MELPPCTSLRIQSSEAFSFHQQNPLSGGIAKEGRRGLVRSVFYPTSFQLILSLLVLSVFRLFYTQDESRLLGRFSVLYEARCQISLSILGVLSFPGRCRPRLCASERD